jgi:integrase
MAIKELKGRAKPYRVYWRNPYTRKIETQHFEKLEDAQKHNSQINHWLKYEPEQFVPEDAAPESSGAITVESVVWAYLQDRQLKPKSLRDTIYHLKAVLPQVGFVQIADLGKQHMRGLVNALRSKGLKANGINRKVGIIKTALNWAESVELIESNPVRNFSCPRGQDEQIPPPSPEELQAMLAVAHPHIQRAIIIGLSFGVRIGESELLSMQWKDVDLVRWRIRIWSAKKNLKQQWRDLDIKESLRPLFSEWSTLDAASGIDYLIHWNGKPVTTIKKAWAATLDRAGITRRIRPYDLRHAHATEALANGADVKAVSENMGHADTTMIHKHYQHVLVKQRQAALNAVPDLVIPSGNTERVFSPHFCITEESKIKQ